ncbi:MAG TPA: hypothetical protein VFF49_10845 [Thermodesulfobacteriota bacterium]|nr:hypothetical protein [Thermodesulfobacteriota bacterium]
MELNNDLILPISLSIIAIIPGIWGLISQERKEKKKLSVDSADTLFNILLDSIEPIAKRLKDCELECSEWRQKYKECYETSLKEK